MIHMNVIGKVAIERSHRKWTVKTIVRQNTGGVIDRWCRCLLEGYFYTAETITILDNTTVA